MLAIHQLTGYPNFASKVVPLGRTFLRPLFTMHLYFPPGSKHNQKRISSQAQTNLEYWSTALLHPPERSIANKIREDIRAWRDVVSTKGFSGFDIRQIQAQPGPGLPLSIPIPLSLVQGGEQINPHKMRAVEPIFMHWGRGWNAMTLVICVNNRAVANADFN